MLKLQKIILFLQCIVGSSYLLAQINQVPFIHLSTKQGLSQGHVSNILKDKNGFMWFCTDNGLNKYDGYTFKIFNNIKNDPSSISNDYALCIVEDKNGDIWVGTASGLDKYDRNKETFTHYTPNKSIAVHHILIDSKGIFWLSTAEGFYEFNSINKHFKQYLNSKNDNNSLSNNYVIKMVEDNDGNYWIGTKDGLNKFNAIKNKFTVYNTNSIKSIASNWIKTLYKDKSGKIWIGMVGGGITSYTPEKNIFSNYKKEVNNPNSLCYNDVLSIAEDNKSNLWIGTENGGISIYNQQANTFLNIKNNEYDDESLSNNSIYSIYKDNIGNMWVGTWSGGINLHPLIGKKFHNYTTVKGEINSLNNSSVIAATAGDGATIWIGTDGGGINKFNTITKKFEHIFNSEKRPGILTNNYVTALLLLPNNKLAVGYHRGAFDILNTLTNTIEKHISIKNPNNNNIEISANCLFTDKDENIWIGTWGEGVLVYNKKYKLIKKITYNIADSSSICSDYVNCFYQMPDGKIWIGTTLGLNIVDNFIVTKKIKSITNDLNSLSHDEINRILVSKNNTIWIATSGGLDVMQNENSPITHYNESNGLPNNLINSIVEDNAGNLWIGSGNGLSVLHSKTKKIRNYRIEDGIQGKEFNFNAVLKDSKGALFFGGTEGFNYFMPDSLVDNKIPPPVFITNLRIFNKIIVPAANNPILQHAITETKSIVLSYTNSVITFEFAALNYTFSENNQYAYMLEGFDNDWIYIGSNRSVTYTNLDAGKYTLKIIACNNDGVWNQKGTSLEIIITPPWWKKWWFLSFLLFTIIISFIYYHHYRIQFVNKQNLLLEKKVQAQTSELVLKNKEETTARIEAEIARKEADIANVKLTISNQEMEQFAYIASHDLKEPLRTTSSFIQLLQKKYQGKLDEEADKYIHFITESTERMKVLITDLLEFSKIGAQVQVSTIDCNQVLSNVLTDLDTVIKETNAIINTQYLPTFNGYETEIKLLLQNLLTNAIKFRKKEISPIITITTKEKVDEWEFAITDNGIGINENYFDKIFKIFQRLHTKSQYEGSGIGLAHCSKIVALHHGKIWVTSTLQVGSTFYFTISKKITDNTATQQSSTI
jgi:signal transduction histidine kinase/ligand-binding sensor domain-containing protein